MRWDSLSSHGLPHIPLVWGQRLTHCFSLFCWKREKNTTRWEEHLIPQLTQEDPNDFNMGGETHPSPHGAPLAKKEKSSAWSEGIFHPIRSPLKKPPIPSVQWLQLTQLWFLFLCKKKEEAPHEEVAQLVIPWGTHTPLVRGRRLTWFFSFVSWKWMRKTMRDERNISSHSSHRQIPFCIWFGRGDSPTFTAAASAKGTNKKHMIRFMLSSHGWSHGRLRISLVGEEDSPNFTFLLTAKEKQKQCTMRGTAHPTALTGWRQHF